MYFCEDNDRAAAVSRKSGTKLTKRLATNEKWLEASQIWYSDVPLHFTCHLSRKMWQLRTKPKLSTAGGGIDTKHQDDRYLLRVLLYHIDGAKPFHDVSRVNRTA